MRRIVAGIAVLSALAVGAGFFGAVHPAADSIAVFRPYLAGLAMVAALALKRRVLRAALVVVMAGLLAWHAWFLLRPEWDGPARLTLYQHNVFHDNAQHDPWLAHVRSIAPDVLALQEIGPRNTPLLEALEDLYPYQIHCPVFPRVGEAVLSRHPFVPGTERCSRADSFAMAQLDTPQGRVWVISTHLGWPWPWSQAAQLKRTVPEFDGIDGPVVVAGDFDSVAWAHSVTQVKAATGTQRVGRQRATLHLPLIGLPVGIDHVLATGRGRVSTRPQLGSDHFGLWAELDPWSGQG